MYAKKLFLFVIYLWLFLTVLIGIVSWVSPYIIENKLASYFNEQGRDITIGGFSLNLFTASVDIEELVISENNITQAQLNRLGLRVDLQSLIQGKVVVDKVDVSGLELSLLKSGDNWQLDGITFPPAKQNSDQQADENTDADSSGWPFYLDRLTISNSRLNIVEGVRRDELTIESLDITKLSVEGEKLVTSVQVQMAINTLPWLLGGEVSLNRGEVTVDAAIKQASLALADIAHYAGDNLPEGLRLNEGEISVANNLKLSINDGGISVSLSNGTLAMQKVKLSQGDLALNLEGLLLENQLQLTVKQAQVPEKTEFTFDIAGLLTVADVKAVQPSSGDILASSDSLSIPEFTISQQVAQPINITLTELLLGHVKLSQVNAESLPAALVASAINVNQIALSPQSLSIEKVDIQGLENALLFDEQQVLKTLVSFGQAQPPSQTEDGVSPEQTSAKASSTEPDELNEAGTFTVEINEMTIAPESKIKVEDLSHKVPLKRSFVIDHFVVKNLQNISPQKEGKNTEASIIAKAGKYGLVKADIAMPWIKDAQTFDGTLDVKNLSLPQYSAYLNKASGISITAGQLDLVVDLKVVDGHFDGKADLHFRGLKLGEQSEGDDGTVHDKSTIGLNTALAQLADDKGNFNIKVPIEGELDDIDIGTGGLIALVIEKALYQSAKSYVFKTMVPYGLVASIAIEAGQQLFKIRLNDLEFNAGQVTLADEQNEFVTELSAMMMKYPDIQVEICPFVTPDEVKAQLSINSTQSASIVLDTIGNERAEALKDKLVNDYQIAPGRLLLCSPHLDKKKGAKPRLAFDID